MVDSLEFSKGICEHFDRVFKKIFTVFNAPVNKALKRRCTAYKEYAEAFNILGSLRQVVYTTFLDILLTTSQLLFTTWVTIKVKSY